MSFIAPIVVKSTAAAPTINLDPQKIDFGRTFCPLWLNAVYENGAWQGRVIDQVEPIALHPAALVLHYGQSIFEGMKAYKWQDGSVHLFRPIENARRLNASATRMAMPTFDESAFVEGVKTLVGQQTTWIPEAPGSLYLRPSMIATEPCIGVRSAEQFLFFVLAMPSGAYFPQTSGQSGAGAVRVLISSSVGRAARGGTGNVKATANYAVTLKVIAEGKAKGCSQVLFLDAAGQGRIEEMGGMNVFFVSGRKLMTPRLNDTILPGITRDSIIKLAPSLGLEVQESDLSLATILDQIKKGVVTEAFACGTAAVVVGIKNFLCETGEEITLAAAPGSVTNTIYDELTGIQRGIRPDPFGWMVKV